ncbi:MAG TPA: trypsin-like peptidase domain-containing protein [Chthonomonadaceae bacterium]|nr:trypsin-like peptidase domain-containing protein [Chthonomonadaceae bacterium]
MKLTRWQKRMARAAVIPAAFVIGAVAAVGLRGNAGQSLTTEPPVQPTAQVLGTQETFEQVATKLQPVVVSITSRVPVRNTSMQMPDMGGQDPFLYFFRNMPGGGQRQFRQQPDQPQFPQYSRAGGSGVIVSSDGWILTNDHVVNGADRVTVTLHDGREYVGKVRPDYRSDLALIKIDAHNLPTAQFANSDQARVGQWAIAFGSPFGLNDTMTVGIISSLNRSEQITEEGQGRYYPSLLQTDAPINPGNSGGPLVDIYGRVLGIDVAIESPSGANAGIGFAIPANTARYIMEQLMTRGSVTRGFLGLAPKSLTYADQQRYGVKEGALVESLQDGTPAAKAGFQPGDVIVRFNGQPVKDEVDLREKVARTAPGADVPVVIRRGGSEQTLHVTLGSAPDLQAAQNTTPSGQGADNTPSNPSVRAGKLGISAANASDPTIRQQFSLKSNVTQGAVVTDVVPGSPAAEAGISPGDVITRLNDRPVTSANQLSEIARGLSSGTSVPVVVRHGDQTLLVQLNLD